MKIFEVFEKIIVIIPSVILVHVRGRLISIIWDYVVYAKIFEKLGP